MKRTMIAAGVAGLIALAGPAFAAGKSSPAVAAGARATQAVQTQVVAASPQVNATTPRTHRSFPDVPPDHWAAQAVQLMAERGIMIGYPNGTFNGGNYPAR